MEDFTPDQVIGIANGYYSMARALNEYQVLHWPELSHEQQLDINAYQNSLLNRAQDLQTRVTRPAFTNVADMARQLQQATADAKIGLNRLRNVSIALNVGALTVALAAYAARANTQGIQTALRELGNLLAMQDE